MNAALAPRIPRTRAWPPFAFAALFGIAMVVLIRQTGLFEGWQPASGALAGRALLGAAGKMTLGELIASYPPAALLPMIGLEGSAELAGLDAGELYSALVGSGLAGLWLWSLSRAGYSHGAALLLTLLLVGNPLFLGAITAGPDAMLTVLGAWLFAMSAFTLRSRGGVNDLIACSASLALLMFAGPLGGAFALASVPFLLLLMPSDVPRRSAFSIYVVLLFPALFGLAGFVFVNWMMLHDALGFLRTDFDLAAQWIGQSWLTPAIPVVFAVASAPALLGMFILVRGRRPVQVVALALLGTLLLSVTLALQTGACRSPIEALCPAVPLVAAAAMRWPPQRRRPLRVGLLLALGLTGGASAMLQQGPLALAARDDTTGSEYTGIRRMAADEQLGTFLAGRSDVLIDAAAHPTVVDARGSAHGLVTGHDTRFALSMLRKRVETHAVAVPAPNYARNADAIARNLPDLYARGPAGMELIYDRDGWRVWSRKSDGNRSHERPEAVKGENP